MIKKVSFVFCIGLLFSCNTISDNVPVEPAGRRLRDIVLEKFPENQMLVGVTCGLWAFDHPFGIIVDREFGYVTPENDFKQMTIHPNNTDWNFKNADIWIEHIKKNNQVLRMHCPIGPQVSVWTKTDRRTPEELETNMTDFLIAVCTKYNDINSIKYMDVVNETVKNGAWLGPKEGNGSWENPWPKIGFDTDINNTPLYIKKAFMTTNKYAPDIKQIYNHHEGPEYKKSWNLIKETIFYLRQNGIRVDAIGWQGHVDNGWATDANIEALNELVKWAHGNDLEFHITEASSFIKNRVNEYELSVQAETYSKIFAVLLDNSTTGCVGWNTWHLTDAYTWRSEYFPSLFDKTHKAKPAYYAIQKCLEDL